MAKISIIIPVYNVKRYLRKCIDSILAQTFTDYEVILVNDGSTDGSEEICAQYAMNDSRIIVVNQSNGGLSAARNTGLKIACGEYIAFVDSDDWIHKDMYRILYENSIKHDADIVMCGFSLTSSERVSEIIPLRPGVEILTNKEALLNLSQKSTFVKMVVVWNKLYKKELWKKLRYPEGFINEDNYVSYKLLYNSNKVVLVEAAMYYYRQRANSIMKKPYTIERTYVLRSYEQKVRYFKRKNETYLHLISIHEYIEKIIQNYYLSKENSIDKATIKKLYQKAFCEIAKYVECDKFRMLDKFYFIVFLLSPNWYKKIFYTKEKLPLKNFENEG